MAEDFCIVYWWKTIERPNTENATEYVPHEFVSCSFADPYNNGNDTKDAQARQPKLLGFDTPFEEWIPNFERYVSNFDKELWSSILVNNIDESFVEIKDFVMLNPSVSYEHLKRRLAHATFDNTGTANPLKVFCNRTQKERESVGKYANILLSWASKAKIREEEMRDRFRTQFLDGLRNAAVREHFSVFLMENRLAEIPESIFMAEITERSFEQQCDLSEQGCEENTKSGEDGVYMATSWQPKNPLYRVSFQNETQPIGTPEPVYRAQKSYNTNQNHTNPPNPYRKPNESNPPSQK